MNACTMWTCAVETMAADRFGAFMRAARAKWAKLVKDVGIEPR